MTVARKTSEIISQRLGSGVKRSPLLETLALLAGAWRWRGRWQRPAGLPLHQPHVELPVLGCRGLPVDLPDQDLNRSRADFVHRLADGCQGGVHDGSLLGVVEPDQ